MIGIALFLLATLAILRLSWHSLHSLKAHGFYRFFAFELLAGIIAVDLPIWFSDPWSGRQIASYVFGAISIGLAAEGFRLLIKIGKPSADTSQNTNFAFENTTRLVTGERIALSAIRSMLRCLRC